ncbi:mechanosensitive ion channel family protein [Desulfosediminicola flagellatus]|uniref:mechanosensitive ion channel family protein n=1 Tax=Desulfosediminicola flagellatus TaxID=2569541 RepID=UPI00142EDCBE|nr:mechanosensitive ion channel family protein [Desulfosediminicola flagellatus]
MKQLVRIVCTVLFFCLCHFSLIVFSSSAEETAESSVPRSEVTTQGKELPAAQLNTQDARPHPPSMWLHMLDRSESSEFENSSVLAFALKVPGDLARVFKSVGGEYGSGGLLYVLFLVGVSLLLGFMVVFGAKRIAGKGIAKLEQISPPASDSLSCLWAGFIRSIPSLASVVVLALSATLVFLLLSGDVTTGGRMLFLLILGIVLIINITSLISKIVFAPHDAGVRPFALNDSVAKSLYRATAISVSVVLSGKLIGRFIVDLGALPQTISWVAIILGTTVIAILGGLVIYLKIPISESLQAAEHEDKNWIKGQLAAYWHVPALLYLLFAWFTWIGQELSATVVRNGSFIISLFIIPIYFVLSYAGRAVIRSVLDSLGVGVTLDPDSIDTDDETAIEEAQAVITRNEEIESKAYLLFRIILATAIATWTLTLWGYDIPFASNAIRAIFESLIILALALMIWRVTSRYIARKIEEATPEPAEKAEEDDNEFGGAIPASRSHTLLPMVRKVLASTLIVMVSLTILSSLGVNIAPILAGAGVLGLAVGFGAQKLVSDVLSGFFFLLDDAFRVGEYIQAGSTKGAVEAITLRNVMLRHHRGMLQIVPHSDLGAITNYMRGGIVIKFPLEFPYDTDIEKVRKIIKKVGQAMLLDEELGDDFILPIKSQGVNEITNSVMIIRVKFTAKPGKQFVIKREAFRRITEALAAKGIHYAHRKVIVDFPDDAHKGDMDEETRKKVVEAGAAAIIAADAADQQKQAAAVQEE